ncbi:contact-dependent growth inhibition system immunity protein [Wocania ichthyoenteri]|uniref:contact-dependent growth inhibition system immunity protein n=1 Tax=Wocania ichthyoenteri TaxID=1230531 RepID=UPI00053E6736|nr:contact-dependent growth inhibition system immunity protein [Wocania ichthyoenteri]
MSVRTKTIEQLENDIWTEPTEFPTGLIERCFRYRKISIGELTNRQLRLLISQKIGLEYLTEIALDKLEKDILIEADFYKGDLLEAVSKIPVEFWTKNLAESKKLQRLVELNMEKIKIEMGEKDFKNINDRIKASAQQSI